jgi:lipopolysaccharide biosynthesis protein/glycosyltransferase involved in cell wall biosynthesis
LVIVAQHPDQVHADMLLDRVDGLFVRENAGYDFAAWAQAMRRIDLTGTELLCLANDSLIGPIWTGGLSEIMARVRGSEADLVGLTENDEFKRHLQSFFLVAKGKAVKALAGFLESVRILENKQEVIMSYEVQLADALEAEGFRSVALFANTGIANRTVNDWRSLIEEGFPFVKMAVLQGTDSTGWDALFEQHGYDVAIVEESLSLALAGESAPLMARQPETSLQQTTAVINTALATDLAAAARVAQLEVDLMMAAKRPWKQVRAKLKFKLYKMLSRFSPPLSRKTADRFARRAQKYDPLRFLSAPVNARFLTAEIASSQGEQDYKGRKSFDPVKQSILIVTHEATRSGAPILALNLAESFSERYNVTCIALRGGELMEDFIDVSEKVIDVGLLSTEAADYAALVRRLCGERDYSFAIVNSVVAHAILKGLNDRGVPSIALLHEFATYIGKKSAFSEAIRWADEAVFSSRLTLESASEFDHNALEMMHHVTVLPQGRCRVPENRHGSERQHAERDRLRELLRPSHSRSDLFIVLGAGTVELRKGVDLFIETAARTLKQPGSERFRFVWVGSGYDPEKDLGYSVYLQDQLRRSRIEDRVLFIPATPEIDLLYELSDALLLTSRLDPLPNVAVDAMCSGLPVLCFSDASGIADLLIDQSLGEDCVGGYLDTADLATKLLALATDSGRYLDVAQRTRSAALAAFDFGDYVAKLENLALMACKRRLSRDQDVQTILEAGTFRQDFCFPPKSFQGSPAEAVSAYLERLDSTAGARKPEPGFNPFIYENLAQDRYSRARDSYADFLARGRPQGLWLTPVLDGGTRSGDGRKAASIRSALHIHGYHIDQLPDILARLGTNLTQPDLFVSVADSMAAERASSILQGYPGQVQDLRIVPNRGRDIGPFLTQFGKQLCDGYAVIGHVHLKKSPHVSDPRVVLNWNSFLLENLLGGGFGGAMIDRIMHRFESDPGVGLIYPDDPHIIGWSRNRVAARALAGRMGITELPSAFNFPVGTMFWIRAEALRPLVDLGLDWGDYPEEPIPIDGTMLHALERLFGLIPLTNGWDAVVTNIQGLTR